MAKYQACHHSSVDFHLRIPFCHPGFKSQAYHLRCYHLLSKFVLNLSLHCEKERKINKKSPELAHLKKIIILEVVLNRIRAEVMFQRITWNEVK